MSVGQMSCNRGEIGVLHGIARSRGFGSDRSGQAPAAGAQLHLEIQVIKEIGEIIANLLPRLGPSDDIAQAMRSLPVVLKPSIHDATTLRILSTSHLLPFSSAWPP